MGTLECKWYPVRATVARWTLVGRCIGRVVGAWLVVRVVELLPKSIEDTRLV